MCTWPPTIDGNKISGLQIDFNPDYYDDLDYVKSIYNANVLLKSSPQGTTWESVGAHELGHVLHGIINVRKNKDIIAITHDWEDNVTSKEIVKEAWNNIKFAYPYGNRRLLDKRIEISLYAKEDYSETIGEALADFYNNEDGAQLLSKEIVNVIKKKLKE